MNINYNNNDNEIRFTKEQGDMTNEDYKSILGVLLEEQNEPHKFIKIIECESLIPKDIIIEIHTLVDNNREGEILIQSCEVQLVCKSQGEKSIDELIAIEKHDDEYIVSLKPVDEEGQKYEVDVINKTKSAMLQLEIMNLGDQIHDFIASGYLTYNAILSYKIILRSQAAMANLKVKIGDDEVSLNFPQKVRLLEKLSTDVILNIDEIEKVNTFKEELDLSSRAEYKKLMKSYGILSEDPLVSLNIFFI